MRLAAAAILLAAATLQAQSPTETGSRLVLDASRALQAGSASRFLGYFDRKQTPDFRVLREGVSSLLADNKVASSVELKPVAARTGEIDFEVDWILQISSERDPGPIDQRRELVKATVQIGENGDAKLIQVDPVGFFAPTPLRP